MAATVICVENLSKQYRLGEIGTGALSHDLKRWWYQLRGKPDPFAKIGEVNDRSTKGSSDYVWALQDINFEVKQGEVLGIIGKNGAGKSTLLKILSKTTTPTTGSVKIKGRIASLLEVGTGFHPELSGRENIFLNGAILGMTKREIKTKFDEIVDFSGVERYIDTPVKRYSSGMYVRLAFAVAAHLDPEILIVDEVLAVGDAEFQKKCLGKMKDVSVSEGRTVLFVSHNIGAINQLCTSALLLDNGVISLFGATERVIANYLQSGEKKWGGKIEKKINEIDYVGFLKIMNSSSNGEEQNEFYSNEKVSIKLKFKGDQNNASLELALSVYNRDKSRVFSIHEILTNYYDTPDNVISLVVSLPANFLTPGSYSWLICLYHHGVGTFDIQDGICPFTIIDSGTDISRFPEGACGSVFVQYDVRKIIE